MDNDIIQELTWSEGNWVEGGRREIAAQPVSEPQRQNDIETLKCFMDETTETASFYRALANKCTSNSRTVFMKISADEGAHLRRLQLEYFLLTGDTYSPPESCPLTLGILSSLRLAYLQERKSARTYSIAAENTKNPSLAALYRELEVDEDGHAGTIHGIMEKAME